MITATANMWLEKYRAEAMQKYGRQIDRLMLNKSHSSHRPNEAFEIYVDVVLKDAADADAMHADLRQIGFRIAVEVSDLADEHQAVLPHIQTCRLSEWDKNRFAFENVTAPANGMREVAFG